MLVSPNVDSPPQFDQILHLNDPYCDPPLARDGYTLRFSNNRYPFLGFFTRRGHTYSNHLLATMHYSYKTFPVVLSDGAWWLSSDLVEEWQELENNLRALTSYMFNKFEAFVPVDYMSFPLPRTYGYAKARATEASMRSAALKSRDAFAALMATCSWLLAIKSFKPLAEAPWFLRLKQDQPTACHWLDEFAESSLANFTTSVDRVGVVVTPGCQFIEYVPKFVEANVPVWLLWDKPGDYDKTICKQYQPPEDVVVRAWESYYLRKEANDRQRREAIALKAPSMAPRGDQAQTTVFGVTDVPTLSEAPKPIPGSRQRRGESIDEFFSRTSRENEQKEAAESSEQRASRLERVEHNASFPLPGKRGARVWEWEQDGVFWVRQPVSRAAIAENWINYAPGHLRYDSFNNEWDLSETFDPSAERPEDPWDEDATEAYMGNEVGHAGSDELRAPVPLDIQTAALEKSYSGTVYHGSSPIPEPLQDILRYRYGFTDPEPNEQLAASTLPLGKALRILCDVDSLWPDTDVTKDQVTAFVQGVMDHNMPATLWDLCPANPAHPGVNRAHLTVTKLDFGGHIWYAITPVPDDSPGWQLVVYDATTVLECLRSYSNPISKRAMAGFFLSTGRPYRAMRTFSQVPPSHQPAKMTTGPVTAPVIDPSGPEVPTNRPFSASGLGWRFAEWKPGTIDFAAYERKRAEFFMSARGQSALELGGIVWRLGMEVISPDAVLDGHMSDVETRELCTDEDLEIVCGVYHVFCATDLDRSAQQAHFSWWPKHEIWQKSPMNSGRWTPWAETWYQRRLKDIKEGKAVLRTAKRWRESLKQCHACASFEASMSEKSADHLN
ncbi:hypothetical protein HWV62_32347 [Athelia sp. TMB]|nr:hypothetical protein HWV62_32347 [Athelia sp. TMB]